MIEKFPHYYHVDVAVAGDGEVVEWHTAGSVGKIGVGYITYFSKTNTINPSRPCPLTHSPLYTPWALATYNKK